MKLKNWNAAKKMLLVYGGLYLLNLLAIGVYFLISPGISPAVHSGLMWVGLILAACLPGAVAVGLGIGRQADRRTLNWFLVICLSNLLSMLFLGNAAVIVLSFVLGPQPLMHCFCGYEIFNANWFAWAVPPVLWGLLLVWALYRKVSLPQSEDEQKMSLKTRDITICVAMLVLILAVLSYPLSWQDSCRKFCLAGKPFQIEAEKLDKIELHWGGNFSLTLEPGTEKGDQVVELLNQYEMRYWLPKFLAGDWGDYMIIYYDNQSFVYFYTQDYIGSGFGSMIGAENSLGLLYDFMGEFDSPE